jgi:hypothetical protein
MKLPRKIVMLGCTGILALTGVNAIAQWHWVDDQGRKVFSDRPPGPEIAEKNILKRPFQAPRAIASAPAEAAASSPVAKGTPAKTGTSSPLASGDKNAVEQAQKLKQEQDRQAASKAQNCTLAQRQMAGLKSGSRIARFNDKGEREFLDEAAKAAEMRQVQKVLDSDCK